VTAGRLTEVYSLGEAPAKVEGVVRCSGDVDEFTALAQAYLRRHRDGRYDAPMALAPPVFRWWRWVPTPRGEFDRVLYEAAGPGRGAWLGAVIRVTQIGCSLCQLLGGRHTEACLNDNITGLVTCQFSRDKKGPLSPAWIHAVRVRGRQTGRPAHPTANTPGPTLCDISRFSGDGGLLTDGTACWQLGGAAIEPGVTYRGCYLCGKIAHDELPGRPILGARRYAEVFAEDTGVALPPHLDPDAPARRRAALVYETETGCW
jgi:hypothetical protein